MTDQLNEQLTYKTNSKLLEEQLLQLTEERLTDLLPKVIKFRHTYTTDRQSIEVGKHAELLIDDDGVSYRSNSDDIYREGVKKCYLFYISIDDCETLKNRLATMILVLLLYNYICEDDVYSAIEEKI